jgi:hypothetical protein
MSQSGPPRTGPRLVDNIILIPKSDKVLNKSVNTDNEKIEIRKMNDLTYSKLICSIDTMQSRGKVGCSIVKGSKSADYKDRNANKAWKGLKAKYQPIQLLVGQSFTDTVLPEPTLQESITSMEDTMACFEDEASTMAGNHFMTQILKSLTNEYLT